MTPGSTVTTASVHQAEVHSPLISAATSWPRPPRKWAALQGTLSSKVKSEGCEEGKKLRFREREGFGADPWIHMPTPPLIFIPWARSLPSPRAVLWWQNLVLRPFRQRRIRGWGWGQTWVSGLPALLHVLPPRTTKDLGLQFLHGLSPSLPWGPQPSAGLLDTDCRPTGGKGGISINLKILLILQLKMCTYL